MLVTQGNVKAIFKGYTVSFWDAYSGSPEPLADSLVMKVPSTGLSEQHNWLTALNGIRKLVDEAQIQDMGAVDFTIVNDEWEETISLKETEVRSDRYGILSPRLQILGSDARGHVDQLLANLLVAGLDGTGLDYTGSAFFDTNKKAPGNDMVAFSNVGTAKLDLNGAAFAAGKQNLRARTNSKGRPLGLGRDFRLIVSAKNEDLALRILQAESIATLAKNVAGAENIGVAATSNIYRGTAKPIVFPWLDAVGLEDAWFLADFGCPMKPFIHQENIPWTYYTVDNPQDSFVLLNHKFLWQVYRFAQLGYGLPELIYGSDGSV